MKSTPVTVVKIGGNVIDREASLSATLDQFAKIEGMKVLVHGGGKLATDLAGKLQIPQTMIDGRRVTSAETLEVAAMVYGGLINKTITASLQARSVNAMGLTGADADLIRARLRSKTPIDYGFVGDVTHVSADRLIGLFEQGICPVVAPITHDGSGQLLNTNADTIAQEIAKALAGRFKVSLVYSFEKPGVLLDVNNEESAIPEISRAYFAELKAQNKIFAGMIPKLENAFRAIDQGVDRVILGRAEVLNDLVLGAAGTRCVQG